MAVFFLSQRVIFFTTLFISDIRALDYVGKLIVSDHNSPHEIVGTFSFLRFYEIKNVLSFEMS